MCRCSFTNTGSIPQGPMKVQQNQVHISSYLLHSSLRGKLSLYWLMVKWVEIWQKRAACCLLLMLADCLAVYEISEETPYKGMGSGELVSLAPPTTPWRCWLRNTWKISINVFHSNMKLMMTDERSHPPSWSNGESSSLDGTENKIL